MKKALFISCMAAFGISLSARAQPLPSHVVHESDTLASISQQYYGDPTKEEILRQANGVGAGAPLIVGQRLVIPTVSYVRVLDGDTWSSIAERVFGLPTRMHLLVAANQSSTRTPPQAGAEILVPFTLTHVVELDGALPEVAKLYYGDDNRAGRRLRRFNELTSNRLSRGQRILVPIFDLFLSDEAVAKFSSQIKGILGAGELRDAQAEAKEKIPKLIAFGQRGEYVEVIALGNQLLGMAGLTDVQHVTIHRELATAYVAIDRDDLAFRAFTEVLDRQPTLELDTVRTSPRVLKVFTQARMEHGLPDAAGSTGEN